jgi:hypothetical protein
VYVLCTEIQGNWHVDSIVQLMSFLTDRSIPVFKVLALHFKDSFRPYLYYFLRSLHKVTPRCILLPKNWLFCAFRRQERYQLHVWSLQSMSQSLQQISCKYAYLRHVFPHWTARLEDCLRKVHLVQYFRLDCNLHAMTLSYSVTVIKRYINLCNKYKY